MTVQNVRPVETCLKCKGKGYVVAPNKDLILMECDDCTFQWFTQSKICPDCQQANGFFVDGPCRKCYKERYCSS